METKKYLLQDLLTIKNGKDHKDLLDGQYPVLGSGGIMRYAEKYLYDKVSILLPRKGTLTNIQYINEPFWTVDTLYYTIINENLADPYYLYCYINSLDLSGYDSGASIPSMTQRTYNKIKINLPDKETQQKLGKMIKSYDDLIENNNKRIKLLEQMAENLYKEWFVRFRFPGYEDAEFENGLPKGWSVSKLSKISEFVYGKMPKEEHVVDNGYPIFSGYRVSGYYDSFMFEDAVLVLIARGVGGTGEVRIAPPCSYITNLAIIFKLYNPDLYKQYLFHMFSLQNLRYLDTGAAQSQITIDNLKNVRVVLPTDELLKRFNDIINTFHQEIICLEQSNANLIKQRDMLLPRLMSGKLEV